MSNSSSLTGTYEWEKSKISDRVNVDYYWESGSQPSLLVVILLFRQKYNLKVNNLERVWCVYLHGHYVQT